MPNLSKSKIIAYRQCPKRLWLEIHKPEERDDSASQFAFNIGHTTGDLAQGLFDPTGTGVLIDINQLSWPEMFQMSAELLQRGDVPVFEAAMQHGGALALADIMLPNTDNGSIEWDMIEVKSSTSVKDYHREDAAIQTCIADNAGVELSSVSIAYINNQFVYPGDGIYDGIFKLEDITEESKGLKTTVEQWIQDAMQTANLSDEPDMDMGPHCSDPFTCGFCDYCSRQCEQLVHPVSLLPRVRATTLEDWAESGILELDQVADSELNAVQLRVKEATLSGETYFNAAGAKAALEAHGFPAYFLDFETINPVVPIWKGTCPYQQIPYQFSLHRMDSPGNLFHEEFLDTSGDDPREELAAHLVRTCGTSGPIYVYNASFEKRIIASLAEQFTNHSEALWGIHSRIVDLLPVVRNHYYHPCQEGSWSLKAVLPAICPELDYSVLEGVHHGMEAGEAWVEAVSEDTNPKRKEELRKQLLEYCQLDTLATVRIWEYFRGS